MNKKVGSRTELLGFIGKSMMRTPIVVEVGVLRGAFSQRILDEMNPSELYLIDTWGMHYKSFVDYRDYDGVKWDTMYANVKKKFAKYGQVKVIRGLSVEEAVKFQDGYFDFVYIDADHDRLFEDLAAWYQKVRQGGWIAGHDYNLQPVQRDVRSFFGENYAVTGESMLPSWYHHKEQ